MIVFLYILILVFNNDFEVIYVCCYKLWGYLFYGEGYFELDFGFLQVLKSYMELILYLKRENMYKFNLENVIYV